MPLQMRYCSRRGYLFLPYRRKMLHRREIDDHQQAAVFLPFRGWKRRPQAASGSQPGDGLWISPLQQMRCCLHETRYLHREKQFLPEQPAGGALIFHLQRHQEASGSSESGPAEAAGAPAWFHECWRCASCVQDRPRQPSQALRPTCGLRLLYRAAYCLPGHTRECRAAGASHPGVRQCGPASPWRTRRSPRLSGQRRRYRE